MKLGKEGTGRALASDEEDGEGAIDDVHEIEARPLYQHLCYSQRRFKTLSQRLRIQAQATISSPSRSFLPRPSLGVGLTKNLQHLN